MSTPSLGMLAAAIQRGQSEIGHVRSATLAGRAKIEEGLRALAALAKGSGRPELPAAIALLTAAVRHAEYSAGAALRADDHLRDYLLERGMDPGGHRDHPAVRDLWDPVRSRPATPAPEPVVLSPDEARARAAAEREAFFRAPLPESLVQEILAGLAAKAASDGTVTSGVWLDLDGTRHTTTTIRPGDPDDLPWVQAEQYWRAICHDVPEGGFLWNLGTVRHAEIIAAIQMRARGITHGSIVINHPDGPCEGKKWACRNILSYFLEEGTSMAIRWPNGFLLVPGKGRRHAP